MFLVPWIFPRGGHYYLSALWYVQVGFPRTKNLSLRIDEGEIEALKTLLSGILNDVACVVK